MKECTISFNRGIKDSMDRVAEMGCCSVDSSQRLFRTGFGESRRHQRLHNAMAQQYGDWTAHDPGDVKIDKRNGQCLSQIDELEAVRSIAKSLDLGCAAWVERALKRARTSMYHAQQHRLLWVCRTFEKSGMEDSFGF